MRKNSFYSSIFLPNINFDYICKSAILVKKFLRPSSLVSLAETEYSTNKLLSYLPSQNFDENRKLFFL